MALSVFLLKTIIFIFICKSDIVISLENLDNSSSNKLPCEIGWHHHGKYCYALKLIKMRWKDAYHACSLIGGILPSIHSVTQNDILVNLMNSEQAKTSWIGGFYVFNNLIWIDGSKVDYRNFWDNQLDESDRCVSMVYNKWANRACDYMKTFICQKNATLSKDNSNDDSQGYTLSFSTLVIFHVSTVMFIIGVVVGVICYKRSWEKKARAIPSAVFSKSSTPDSNRKKKLSTEDIVNDQDQENATNRIINIRNDFN